MEILSVNMHVWCLERMRNLSFLLEVAPLIVPIKLFFLLEVTRTVISGETSHLAHCVHNQERQESTTVPKVLGPLCFTL